MIMTETKLDHSALAGLRILVVEDMFLVALDLTDQLADWGCAVVGPAAHVTAALELIADAELDGALLDVNLDGNPSFPIAAALSARGVPFIFLTGYDGKMAFPPEFGSIPKLSKPASAGELVRSITAHFGRERH